MVKFGPKHDARMMMMMMICILLLNRCGHKPIHIVPSKFLFILQFVGALVLVSLAHFLRNVLRLFAT